MRKKKEKLKDMINKRVQFVRYSTVQYKVRGNNSSKKKEAVNNKKPIKYNWALLVL